MEKTFLVEKYGKMRKLGFYLSRYCENQNLFVGLLVDGEDGIEPWSDVTVNLSVPLPDFVGFIDVNDGNEDLPEWLERIGAGRRTGRAMRSGFVVYPEFSFNPAFFAQHYPNEYAKVKR